MKSFNLSRRLTFIFIQLITISFITSCEKHEHEAKNPKLEVTNAWRQNIIIPKRYVAKIQAIQHIELRAFEKGYLQKILVDEGQLIKKDQEMFQIMPLLNQAEYLKAKAEYDLAKIEYNNTKILQQKQVVSNNELALAKAKLDKARAELKLNKTHLDLTTVKAPFDGIMDKFKVRLGSLVEEGELLTSLSDNGQIWVYFNVSEIDYLDYKENKKSRAPEEVELELANGRIFHHKGIIDTIEADFNSETGNVAFRATFDNPDRLLRHGETGNIILKHSIENALMIPQKATFEILDKKFVYVISNDNKVTSRQIVIEEEIPHYFAIKSGLKETDRILIEGLGKVRPGDIVEPVMTDSKTVMAKLDLPLE